jgi:hypothetical protein
MPSDGIEPPFDCPDCYGRPRGLCPNCGQIGPEDIEPPFNSDAATTLAWLMWCFQEGYKTAEDRAVMENWMGEHQDNAEDESTRQALLEMATEILIVWRQQ